METGENQSLLNRRESRGCCIRCCRSCCVGCVCSKGILLLLTWSVLVHSFGIYLLFQILANNGFHLIYYFIAVSVVQAVVFFLYPVAGLLGELYFSRQQIMIGGTILSLIGVVITVPLATVELFFSEIYSRLFITISCFGIVIYQFGLGLFESNAIQFGTDRLQFGSNDKFVNWYFWSILVLYFFLFRY